MMLLFAQIFELAEAYLALGITITESITISPLQITYAWMSFISTVALIAFVRICELYDKSGKKIYSFFPFEIFVTLDIDFEAVFCGLCDTSNPFVYFPIIHYMYVCLPVCIYVHVTTDYLYLSVLCQIFVFVAKIYKVILLTDSLDLNDLRPILIQCTIVCLMLLVLLDSYTVYVEVS